MAELFRKVQYVRPKVWRGPANRALPVLAWEVGDGDQILSVLALLPDRSSSWFRAADVVMFSSSDSFIKKATRLYTANLRLPGRVGKT